MENPNMPHPSKQGRDSGGGKNSGGWRTYNQAKKSEFSFKKKKLHFQGTPQFHNRQLIQRDHRDNHFKNKLLPHLPKLPMTSSVEKKAVVGKEGKQHQRSNNINSSSGGNG